MRPTSRSASVDKVDVDLDAVAGGRGAHDGADALRSASTTTNDPAEIAGDDLDLELQAIPAFDGIDPHGVCVVDDRTDDVSQHRRRGGGAGLARDDSGRRNR